jgi:hypothetical protein
MDHRCGSGPPGSPDPPRSLRGRPHHRHGRRIATTGVTGIRPGPGIWLPRSAGRRSPASGVTARGSRHLRARPDGYGCGTVHILWCTVPHPHPNPRPVPDQRAGGRPGAGRGGTSRLAPAGHRRGAARVSSPVSPRAGQVLTGGGNDPPLQLDRCLDRQAPAGAFTVGIQHGGAPDWHSVRVVGRYACRMAGFPSLMRTCSRVSPGCRLRPGLCSRHDGELGRLSPARGYIVPAGLDDGGAGVSCLSGGSDDRGREVPAAAARAGGRSRTCHGMRACPRTSVGG